MSLPSHRIHSVPAETARVAHQVFPKGNRYLLLRDELGTIYEDADFATVYSTCKISRTSGSYALLVN